MLLNVELEMVATEPEPPMKIPETSAAPLLSTVTRLRVRVPPGWPIAPPALAAFPLIRVSTTVTVPEVNMPPPKAPELKANPESSMLTVWLAQIPPPSPIVWFCVTNTSWSVSTVAPDEMPPPQSPSCSLARGSTTCSW